MSYVLHKFEYMLLFYSICLVKNVLNMPNKLFLPVFRGMMILLLSNTTKENHQRVQL